MLVVTIPKIVKICRVDGLMIAIILNNKISNKYQHKNKQLQEVEDESVPAMACTLMTVDS
jgi:hypothetical protein